MVTNIALQKKLKRRSCLGKWPAGVRTAQQWELWGFPRANVEERSPAWVDEGEVPWGREAQQGRLTNPLKFPWRKESARSLYQAWRPCLPRVIRALFPWSLSVLLTFPFRIHHGVIRNSPQAVEAVGRKEKTEHKPSLNLGPHLWPAFTEWAGGGRWLKW